MQFGGRGRGKCSKFYTDQYIFTSFHRNSQTILIIVIQNVLTQEEVQHGKYQPKKLKSVKTKYKLKKITLFAVVYKREFAGNLDGSQHSLPYLEYTCTHCSTQCFACCATYFSSLLACLLQC